MSSNTSTQNSPVASRSPSPAFVPPQIEPEPERAASVPAPKTKFSLLPNLRAQIRTKDERIAELELASERDGAELDALRQRIADLEEAMKSKRSSGGAAKPKKYQGTRIKKEKMADYDKAALDEAVPEGFCEPDGARNGNHFTYGLPLRDDGSLIETGYIYNGLRWTTDEFAVAVAECLKRADIKSLHYEKGYWHAKTGDVIRGKSSANAPTSRVFIKGSFYDDKANKVAQKESEHGGEQNLKQTLLRWAAIKGAMTPDEWTTYFRSIRFPEPAGMLGSGGEPDLSDGEDAEGE